MPITIKLEDSALRPYLQQLHERISDLSPVMDSIGHALEQNMRARYETRRDPDGNKWGDWEKSTKDSYPWRGSKAARRDGPGRGLMLERYGSMFDGLSYTYGKNSVSIGFNQPYAAYHEWGTKRMKRRGLLTSNPNTGRLGEKDAQSIIDIVQEYLSRPVK